MNITGQHMADYRRRMQGLAPRKLGALERALRRHMQKAQDKFDELTSMPPEQMPATASGFARLERKRAVTKQAVDQYANIIQYLNRAGGVS